MTPEKRLFLAELRAGREPALKRLRAALRETGGRAREAARVLGIGVQTLYDARDVQPAVRQVMARYGMGRAGAAAVARSSVKTASPKKNGENAGGGID